MELPKIHTSGSGMLSGIKSKLGFQGKDQQQDDYAYDDGYYDDGYGDDYDDGYEDYVPARARRRATAAAAASRRAAPAPMRPPISCPSTTCAPTHGFPRT